MYCPKCGSPNEKTAKFCINCGERLPVSEPPEAKLPAPTRPPDAQQRQGPERPQPVGPSKRSGRPKLGFVMPAVILVLLLILAAELVLLLTGWPEQTPTPAAIATLPATVQTPDTSPSPSSAATPSPSATFTPLPPTLEPTQPAEAQEVQPRSDVPTVVLSAQVESFAIAGGRVFVESGDGQIQAFDIRTGETLWAARAGGKVLGADPDLVYAWAAELRVDALDAGTGEFRWRSLFQEPAIPVTANDSFVLLVGVSAWYVLDKSNGSVVSTSRAKELRPSCMLGRNTIETSEDEYGRLSDDGHVEWLRSDVHLRKYCDDMLVYSGADTPRAVEALDVNTGSPLWKAGSPSLSVDTWAGPHIGSVFLSATDFFPSGWGSSMLPWGSRALLPWGSGPCGTENVYARMDERGTLAALSKATGELRWSGLDVTENAWLGEAGGMVIYSRPSYGWTQAYDATDHAMIWENPHVVLGWVVGVAEDTLVGTENNPGRPSDARVIVGLDPKTGKELWRREPGEVIWTIQLMHERIWYTLEEGQSGIWFIEPRTGEVMVQIPFPSLLYRVYATDGMIVAVAGTKGPSMIAVIRP